MSNAERVVFIGLLLLTSAGTFVLALVERSAGFAGVAVLLLIGAGLVEDSYQRGRRKDKR